jgi:CheY-like chemotaxis protein
MARAAENVSSENSDMVVPDYFQQEKNRRIAREQQEHYRIRVPIAAAVRDDVPSAVVTRRQSLSTPPPSAETWPEAGGQILLSLGAFALVAGLVARRFAPGFLHAVNAKVNPWATVPAGGGNLSTKVRAEDDAFTSFLAAFRAGPMAAVAGQSGAAAVDPAVRAAAINTFYEKVPHTLENQQMLLREIDRTPDEAGRQKMLAALRWEMHALRNESDAPELLPVWQMSFALEGLLKQLTDHAADVTPSTLRTLGGALEFLQELCHPGVEPDLLTRQPLRFLAVDDDAISRKAVAFALKRALNEPELAEEGEAALALANRQSYDVIFLDVQMPGMDGFELCSKIHLTETNRDTPVVFVTCQSDFEARAKSALSGGSDLIGKPFLTFEITVKALTLGLQRRLAARAHIAESAAGLVAMPAPGLAGTGPDPVKPVETTDCAGSSRAFADQPSGMAARLGSPTGATEFLTRAAVHRAPLREAFRWISQTSDESTRQDLLADVFLRLHSLTPKDNLPADQPVVRLSVALEGLLRKLLQNPCNVTESTLATLASGVELFDDLCGLKSPADLLTSPAIRILVVDDDPVARRAVVGALQLAFKKPESAESGEAALSLTNSRRYDVIFLDVIMPGMDGFEVCSKLRASGLNGLTPVVFVTGQNDFQARTRMSASGGSDFVGKPFLNSEITVKALTFVLRSRLAKLAATSPCENASTPDMAAREAHPASDTALQSRPG